MATHRPTGAPGALRALTLTDSGGADLEEFLATAGVECVVVESSSELLGRVTDSSPDLVVVDLDHQDAMGLVVCSAVREHCGELMPIVVVSERWQSPADHVPALLLGADECLPRPLARTESIARLRRVARRAGAVGAAEAVAQQREPAGDVERFGLTAREEDVLRLMISGASDGEMALALSISPNTVAAHTQRILRKLGARNRVQAAARAVSEGWPVDAEAPGSGALPDALHLRARGVARPAARDRGDGGTTLRR